MNTVSLDREHNSLLWLVSQGLLDDWLQVPKIPENTKTLLHDLEEAAKEKKLMRWGVSAVKHNGFLQNSSHSTERARSLSCVLTGLSTSQRGMQLHDNSKACYVRVAALLLTSVPHSCCRH